MPTLTGIRSVKLPVRDLERSRRWWAETFGYRVTLEFPDEAGDVRGVAGHLAGPESGTGLSLREQPDARTVEGLELMLGVADRAALEQWVVRLDDTGVPHSPIIDATLGWLVVLADPDGHELHLYTDERHHLDQSERVGFGRAVAADRAE